MFPGYKQVLAVGILLDANGIRQGDPNYSNQVVMPGDRLVRIESRPVNVLERLEWWAGSDKEMLEFLNGPEGTEVRVQLERNHDEKTYEVVLKRHVPAVPSKTVAQPPSAKVFSYTERAPLSTAKGMRAFEYTYTEEREKGKTRQMETTIGGVGVAIQRVSLDDKGPVMVQFVSEMTELNGKVSPNDRLVSVNSEAVDQLPIKTICALIDGQVGTPVRLKFEHVQTKRSIRDYEAFWNGVGRQLTDIVTTETFDLTRSEELPFCKATDADRFLFLKANTPRDEIMPMVAKPSFIPDLSFDLLSSFTNFPSNLPASDNVWNSQEPVVGILQVVISAAKNVPIRTGVAGVFVRVACAGKTCSTGTLYDDSSKRASAINPVWNEMFKFPIHKNQHNEDLRVEVIHKSVLTVGNNTQLFGKLKLPKATSFLSSNGAQYGWYKLTDAAESPIDNGFEESKPPLLHIHVSWHPEDMPKSSTAENNRKIEHALPLDKILTSNVMRGRYCLHMMAECAKSPYYGVNYPLGNVDKDFLEEERFEAVEAMAAIIKLKEHVQVSTERERQISAELKEAHIRLQRSSSSNERNAKELVRERERGRERRVCVVSDHIFVTLFFLAF